ncbi:hypothetical protein ACS0TY_029084 [Phlomoides rotata]
MNTKVDQKLLSLILTGLVLLRIPSFLCQNNDQYQTCNQPFQCGRLSEIGYPFYGGNRPVSCGYPGFELDCQGGDHPLINISSITYRVLKIDNSTQTLQVSRNDLWSNICPGFFSNTTLNFTLFDFYRPANDRNITLYYGCPLLSVSANYMFNCSGFNTNIFNFFGTVEQSLQLCSSLIYVPVNQNAYRELANPTFASVVRLESSLESGFSIQWSADNQRCDNCKVSGGVCGYNQTTTSFSCHCSNGTSESTCFGLETGDRNGTTSGNGSRSSSGSSLKIGLPIVGAVLAGAGFAWLVFYCRKQKKQRTQHLGSQSTQTTSSKMSTPPLLKFTTSIPSYPSSMSDLGRGSTYFGVQVFDYSELEVATDNFNPSRELGDGGFGTVYYGVLSDGREVAVKLLYENNFKRVEQFMNEVEILTKLRHKNLVTLHGCTSKRSRQLLLVYEYIPNGTVADHLNGNRSKSGRLSWPVRLNIAIETAEALAYLHKSEIIHRDVKTNNILLDNDFHVKVADFGLSRLFPTNATHVSTAPQGTPGYVDPEYYQCYQLTEKSDVYSFGVVLIELISSLQAVDTNRHRHDINLANMAINKIQNHALHELVDSSLGFETSSAARRMATLIAELAFRCLQQEKDPRPSMEEVLEALRRIQNEDLNAHKVEIVDIFVDDDDDDDTGPLKGSDSPPSSESFETEKLGRGLTTNSSSSA